MADTTPDNTTPTEQHPFMQTYKGDADKALNAVEAPIVQEMMRDARDREAREYTDRSRHRQRAWYTTGTVILIILAIGALGYGVYYFKTLTVYVTPTPSVGVFQTTDPIDTSNTTIQQVLKDIEEKTPALNDKPLIINLVKDSASKSVLDPTSFFTFIESRASEPFVHAIEVARLGVVDLSDTPVPFVIVSVADRDIAHKEFLIAEPKLLDMFASVFASEFIAQSDAVGTEFESTYLYNIPVRILRTTTSSGSSTGRIVVLYGEINDHTMVFATRPEVLKVVYESSIKQ